MTRLLHNEAEWFEHKDALDAELNRLTLDEDEDRKFLHFGAPESYPVEVTSTRILLRQGHAYTHQFTAI